MLNETWNMSFCSGATKGYEEELLGYTARSRQQSLDRKVADVKKENKKSMVDRDNEQADVTNKEMSKKRSEIRKPPTAPRKK